MITVPVRSAADTMITVTDTATNLYDLMNVAGGAGAQKYYDNLHVGGLIINALDGDVRMLTDDVDPTSAAGELFSSGVKEYIPGLDLSQVKLIRVGGTDVSCFVKPVKSERTDSPSAVAPEVKLEVNDIEIGAVEIKDHDGVDRVEVDSDNRLKTKGGGLAGASTNGTSALTGANTWVQVPTAAPASDYVLVVSKENAAGVIRWSFENGGTPSATNGNKMTNSDIIFTLKSSEVVYFGSSTNGDDVNWATKII